MVIQDNVNDLSPNSCHYNQFIFSTPDDLNNHFQEVEYNHSIGLTIFHINCAGLNAHYSELLTFFQSLTTFPDVLVFTETHLDNYVPFNFMNYFFVHKFNKHTTYDGISIFYNPITIKDVEEINTPYMYNSNTCFLQFNFNNEKYNVIGVYRSPSRRKEIFVEELKQLLQTIPSENINSSIIIGDINININHKDKLDKIAHDYLDIVSENGFCSLIDSPTRVQIYCERLTETSIDHILLRTSNSKTLAHSFIIETKITDHYPTILSILKPKVNKNNNSCSSNFKSQIDWSALRLKLVNERWSTVYNCNTPVESLQCFYDSFYAHIKDCTSIKTISNKNKRIKPWITQGLLNSIRYRDKLSKLVNQHLKYCSQHKISPDISLINKYKNYRNFLKNLLRITRDKFDTSCINNSLSDSKKLWKNINNIVDRSLKLKTPINRIITETKEITDSLELSNEFNSFFINISKNIASQTGNNNFDQQNSCNISSDTSQLNNLSPQLKSFSKIDVQEVVRYILSLKDDSAPGLDNLTSSVLKNCSNFIANPLTHIFNLCLEHDTFPVQFKKSLIIPIHKGKESWKLDNYRPIALLSHLSKVLEKCIKFRLASFLEENYLFSPNQYGFREGHSTDEAIFKLTKKIYNSLDNKKKSLCIFLDIRKAFDTINFNIAYQKLTKLGITDKCLNFIRSYLEDRTQVCKIDGSMSNEMKILNGVPQGSVLGPLIFLIYINSLCQLNIDGNIFCYADDTALFFEDRNWDLVFQKANNFFFQVHKWFIENKLFLNESKSVVLCFHNNVKTAPPTNLCIKFHKHTSCLNSNDSNCLCHQLARVKNIKYLGVIIDDKVKWADHIKLVTNKIRKCIYIFYRLRHLTSKDLLTKIYMALIESVIGYGITGWGGVFESHANSLIISQKHLLKIMLCKSKFYPTHDLFMESKILNIKQLYVYRSFKFMKTHSSLFDVNVNNLNLRTNREFNLPQINTKLGHNHFAFLGPKLIKKVSDILFNSSKINLNSNLRSWVRTNIKSWEL